MTAITEEVAIREHAQRAMRARQRMNFVVFLGPAAAIIGLIFVLPIIVDIVIAFSDMGRNLTITEFTTRNFKRAAVGDRRLPGILLLTFVYVFATLAIFNVTFGLVLALTTTAIPRGSGSFFRTVWLLPRMSPSVVYIVLWQWSVHSGDSSLVNQVLMNVFGFEETVDLLINSPLVIVIFANGFIGASFGMIILTSAIRGIPDHLFYAARCDGAGPLAIIRYVTMPALRWPLTYIGIWQTLSLLVSFEYILLLTGGGPFQDTTVFALYIYRRTFASGQYGYGAALALFLIVPGIVIALLAWKFSNMKELLQEPRIEVH